MADAADYFEEHKRRLLALDPVETPSAWMSEEVHQALQAIDEPYKRHKITTVLRLAEGIVAGIPKRDILALDDTCNVVTWYGKTGGQKGWSNDEKIAHAFDVALRRANWWYDQQEGQRIAMRQRLVSEAESAIAQLTVPALAELRNLITEAQSERIKLDAVIEVLDRADASTARKAQHEVRIGETKGPTMRDIRNRTRQRDRIEDDGEVVDVVPEGASVEDEPPIPLQQLISGMGRNEQGGEEQDGDSGD